MANWKRLHCGAMATKTCPTTLTCLVLRVLESLTHVWFCRETSDDQSTPPPINTSLYIHIRYWLWILLYHSVIHCSRYFVGIHICMKSSIDIAVIIKCGNMISIVWIIMHWPWTLQSLLVSITQAPWASSTFSLSNQPGRFVLCRC